MESSLQFVLKLRRQGFDPFRISTYLELRRQLQGCRSVLDVGCGEASGLRWFGLEHLVGIEGYAPSFEKAKERQTHHELVLGDARQLQSYFVPNQFDACIAVDVIEHLTREDGILLAKSMETVSRKKSILFTPNGFLPQQHFEQDDLQHHFSGWEPRDLQQLGYEVTGMLGPRGLRGEHHILKHRPKAFWSLVSLLGHWSWTRRHPQGAAALLAVKAKAPTAV